MKTIKLIVYTMVCTSALLLISTLFPALYMPQDNQSSNQKIQQLQKDFSTISKEGDVEVFQNIVEEKDFTQHTDSNVIQQRAEKRIAENIKNSSLANLSADDNKTLALQVKNLYESYMPSLDISSSLASLRIQFLTILMIAVILLFLISMYERKKNRRIHS